VTSRERLERAAYLAGYDSDTLRRIAAATLPYYHDGLELDDPRVEQITSAVEVLAQAGATADEVVALIYTYERSGQPDWRERFWTRQMRAAGDRFARPEIYGLSPCEDDPQRLAAYGAVADVATVALAAAAPAQIPLAA